MDSELQETARLLQQMRAAQQGGNSGTNGQSASRTAPTPAVPQQAHRHVQRQSGTANVLAPVIGSPVAPHTQQMASMAGPRIPGQDNGERQEAQKLELTADDVERISLKVYDYLKRRLAVERERLGRPGFSL